MVSTDLWFGFIAKKDNCVSWSETADHYEKRVREPDSDWHILNLPSTVIFLWGS